MKDPENIKPQFKPDLSISQKTVQKTFDNGFDGFLKDMTKWMTKKDKKLKIISEQSQQFQFKPVINRKSSHIFELSQKKKVDDQLLQQRLGLASYNASANQSPTRLKRQRVQSSRYSPLNPLELVRQQLKPFKRQKSTSELTFKPVLSKPAKVKQESQQKLPEISQEEVGSTISEEERQIRARAAQFVEKLANKILTYSKERISYQDHQDNESMNNHFSQKSEKEMQKYSLIQSNRNNISSQSAYESIKLRSKEANQSSSIASNESPDPLLSYIRHKRVSSLMEERPSEEEKKHTDSNKHSSKNSSTFNSNIIDSSKKLILERLKKKFVKPSQQHSRSNSSYSSSQDLQQITQSRLSESNKQANQPSLNSNLTKAKHQFK